MSYRISSSLCSVCLLAVLPTACLDHPLKQVEYESVTEIIVEPPVVPRRKVDILFVIDNSGSMGEEQAVLAANFSAFVEVLERPEVDADYRIAITTTDDGHAWCSGTGPEAGTLQLRTCRSHIDDFVFSPGSANEVDRIDEACLEVCPEALADLSTLPTEVAGDTSSRPRAWLERSQGRSNVPQGVTTAQALGCWGPQGINGCGYESPLESMRKALLRSGVDGDPGQGFLRDDALLQVVFITDEADCSVTSAGFAAFDPDGTRTLWPDPDAALPASAVCWNAGVSCSTASDGSTHCEPADLDAEGRATAATDAMLHPVSRYLEVLEGIDMRKREINAGGPSQVLVSVIGGVPSGYDGRSLDYGPGSDPQFLDDFGVGAGCSSANGEAVPPVRLRAVAEAFTDEPGSNLFSICDADYKPALEEIAEILVEKLRPNCVRSCVVGVDALQDGDLPTCTIAHERDGVSSEVPTCLRSGNGPWERPDGEDLCVYAVTGDDLHLDCQVEGQNLELRFLWAPDASIGEITPICEASGNPQLDCPAR